MGDIDSPPGTPSLPSSLEGRPVIPRQRIHNPAVLYVHLPRPVHLALQQAARNQNLTMSYLVRELVEGYLDPKGTKPATIPQGT